MKSIEERASDFIKSKDTSELILTHNGVSGAAKEIYKIGATDQREIDIQRAREIRCQLCAGLCKGNAACGELKEITKYMKG